MIVIFEILEPRVFQNLKLSQKINKFNFPLNFFNQNGKKAIFPIYIRKMNLLILLLIWQNLRFRNICQVFLTGMTRIFF